MCTGLSIRQDNYVKIFANRNNFSITWYNISWNGDFKGRILASWGAKKMKMSICQELSTQWFTYTANKCMQVYAVSHVLLFDC